MQNLKYTGTCVDYSSEGHGIVKTKDGVIFVYGLFLGEEAEISVEYKRAGIMYGKVIKLLKKSEHRIQPKCHVCSLCGGCQFHQIDYESELIFKREKVKNAFKNIAHIKVDVEPVLGMDNPYNYRNKIQMPLGFDKKKNIVSGFYKAKSHEIVPIDECQIENEQASEILKEIKYLMKSMKIPPYDEDTRKGIIRHILIRTSFYRPEIMVTIITNCDSFLSRNNFVKELIKRCHKVTTVVQNINTRDTNVILGEREKILYGKGYIEDSLCDLVFKISSKSFYQTNPIQTEVLYRTAINFANLKKSDVVFDAYSGIGTIGLIASKKCKEVISVELVKEAYLNAIQNAKLNGIANFTPINDDATEYAFKLANEKRKIDVLFMDPPRKGSTEKFLNSIISLAPKKIVYVSCDPATLARDVAYISNKYEIEKIQPVDLFPRTFHVETVVLMSRDKE